MTASRKNRFCISGSQRRSLNAGIIRSNFTVPVIIRAAKFCTDCSLQIFCSRCLTTLCNSKAFITATSCLRSRTCLTRLICARLDTQDGMVFKTRSANISCGSRTTPRSLAQDVTARSFAEIDILKSGRYNPVPSWVFWHDYVLPIQTMDHGSTTLNQTRPLAKKEWLLARPGINPTN